jgi:hypothetical protein
VLTRLLLPVRLPRTSKKSGIDSTFYFRHQQLSYCGFWDSMRRGYNRLSLRNRCNDRCNLISRISNLSQSKVSVQTKHSVDMGTRSETATYLIRSTSRHLSDHGRFIEHSEILDMGKMSLFHSPYCRLTIFNGLLPPLTKDSDLPTHNCAV